MRADELDYDLPGERIAQHPLAQRDEARLLVVNATRVLPARLVGRRAGSGARIELLLLGRPVDGACDALARPGKRLKVGDVVTFGEGRPAARVEGADGRIRRLRFEGDPDRV